MALRTQFIAASVAHARLRPARNRFRYRVPYLAIPSGELEGKARHGLLSIDGANPAARLFLKAIASFRKPAAPASSVSH